MKRIWLLVISGVILLSVGGVFTGCIQNFMPTSVDAKLEMSGNAELTRREELALLKTQSNHKASMDELYAMVNAVVQQTTPEEGRYAAGVGKTISGVKKVPLRRENRFASAMFPKLDHITIADPEEEPVEVYEFVTGEPGSDDEGFAWVSNDIRIGLILAIAEGSLEDTSDEFIDLMYAYLQDYISSVILEYNSITEAEIEEVVEKAVQRQSEEARKIFDTPSGYTYSHSTHNFIPQKEPLLTTRWGQGDRGSSETNMYGNGDYAYNNYVKYKKNKHLYITGCGPTAIAQIVTYHGYMKPTVLKKPAAFNETTLGIPFLGVWNGTYDFPFLKENGIIRNPITATTIDTADMKKARGQVAALMYHIGDLTNANYKDSSTTTFHWNERTAFEDMGYIIHYSKSGSATSKTGTLDGGFSVTCNTSWTTIKDALNNNRPILASGSRLGEDGKIGHVWVIDGWGTMTSYYEYYKNTATGKIDYSIGYGNLTNNFMVHCNLGWDGSANGWYIYGMFNTEKMFDLPRSAAYERDYSINTAIIIPKKP